MTSNSFEVENYEVQIQPHYVNTHDIHLTGPRLSHGIQHGAALNFMESPSDEGHVTNVGARNFDGHQVTANIDVDLFDDMYRLLQTEDPVNFYYSYESGDDSLRDLYSAQLLTSEEPIGEGPVDESP